MTQQNIDPHAWLLGSGTPAAKFDTLGKTVAGPIVDEPVVRQQTDFDTGTPRYWDNGDPMMQLLVTVATDERDPQITDDNGHRRVYVKGNMQAAVAAAVRSAGAKLAPGGILSVTYLGDEEPKKKGMSGAKRYTATYQPPTEAFLNQQQTPQQHPAQQAAAYVATTPAAPAPQQPAAPAAQSAPPQQPPQTPTPPAPQPPAVDAAALAAALNALTPEQRTAMGLPPA